MKSHYFVILLCSICSIGNKTFAQSQKSIVSSGGNVTGPGGSISYSIGQVAYTTAKGTTGSVAQGIQDVNLSTVLPITLKTFTGECLDGNVKLNWTTETEINNNYFNIEKSNDAQNWTSIATIKGANTSTIAHTYQYTDVLPNTTATYYRLKQVDLNGSSTFSQVVYILNCSSKTAAITLYPNPASEGVYINIPQFAGLSYSLYDMSGKLLHEAALIDNTSYISLANLAKAVYFLKIKSGNTNIQTFRISKN